MISDDIDYFTPTNFCAVMGKHGSDKGHAQIDKSWHNYTIVYHELFKNLVNKKLRIFELGLGTNNTDVKSNMGPNGKPGASLYGWDELFPNSTILGADIDKRILFQTDRIKTFYCDQTNTDDIKTLWDTPECLEPFDIIIEDGLHEFDANVIFFENSIHKLNPDGYYIIEDISVNIFGDFLEKIDEWETKYPDLEFQLVRLSSNFNSNDNNLLIVHRRV